jgi:hypothetical protein
VTIVIPLTVAIALFFQAAIGRTVLATVLDGRNQPVVDLETDDFVVRESGQAREVLSARIADYPVLVLIDNSAQAGDELEAIRQAAARFITRIGQRPVAVGTLGGTPTIIASFEEDRAVVLERLGAVRSEPSGRNEIVQGLATGAQAIRTLDVPFSAIVAISASSGAPVGDAPTEWLQQILNSHAIADVIVRRSGAATTTTTDPLRALVEQTRGQLATIYSTASYQIALDHLADQMAGEMMIEYIVPGDAPRKEDVTVGVRLPGLRVKGLGVR